MVNPAKRMRRLVPKLFNIQYGSGAAVLPPPPAPRLAGVVVRFPKKEHPRSQGPTWFVRDNLRRLKFHNPSIPIRVEDRPEMQLSLTFESIDPRILGRIEPIVRDISKIQQKPTNSDAAKDAGTSPGTPASTDPIYTRDVVLNLEPGEPLSNVSIWEWFQKTTNCKDVPVPIESQAKMDELRQFEAKAAVDRKRVKAGMDAMRKEREELKRAREAADRLTSEA